MSTKRPIGLDPIRLIGQKKSTSAVLFLPVGSLRHRQRRVGGRERVARRSRGPSPPLDERARPTSSLFGIRAVASDRYVHASYDDFEDVLAKLERETDIPNWRSTFASRESGTFFPADKFFRDYAFPCTDRSRMTALVRPGLGAASARTPAEVASFEGWPRERHFAPRSAFHGAGGSTPEADKKPCSAVIREPTNAAERARLTDAGQRRSATYIRLIPPSYAPRASSRETELRGRPSCVVRETSATRTLSSPSVRVLAARRDRTDRRKTSAGCGFTVCSTSARRDWWSLSYRLLTWALPSRSPGISRVFVRTAPSPDAFSLAIHREKASPRTHSSLALPSEPDGSFEPFAQSERRPPIHAAEHERHLFRRLRARARSAFGRPRMAFRQKHQAR